MHMHPTGCIRTIQETLPIIMKNILSIILIFHFGVYNFNYSDVIIGTWRVKKTVNLRTLKEDKEITRCNFKQIKTENGTGYPDRTFKVNGDYVDYYTANYKEYGKWEIADNNLVLNHILEKKNTDSNKELLNVLKSNNLIFKEENGFYYLQPTEIKIKSINKNRIQLGTDSVYTIYKRVK